MKRVLIPLVALVALIAGLLVAKPWSRSSAARSTKKADIVAAARPTVPPPRAQSERDVELDDDRPGTIRLEGQVIDANAQPVGGATVTIDSRPTRTAVTEQDGSFVFENLMGRGYELIATSGELVAGPVGVQVTERTEPVVLRLSAGATLTVDVVLARDQKPVSSARVELHGLLDRDATTDAAGRAAFRGVVPGWYAVVATAPGLAPSTTFAGVGSDAMSVRLELVAGAAVAGRVIDPDGKPVGGAKVRYEGVSDWTQGAGSSITTAADGTFRMAALPAGSFRFSARDDRYAPGTTSAIVLDGTTPREDITIQLQPGATITGLVVDANKQPVPWARVRAREQAAGIPMQRTRETTAGADGTFRLSGMPRTAMNVVALGDDTTSKTARVDLVASPDARVELALELTGILAGHVVDSKGEPIEGAQVYASREESDSATDAALRGEPFALTSSSGAFEFRGLDNGQFSIHTNPPNARADFATLLLREEVKATVGDRNVRIVLPADGGIKGKVVLADGGSPAAFTLSLGAWGSGITVSTKDGAFEVKDLPPRQYHVTIRGATFAETTLDPITIAPGKTVDVGTITVRKGRSISGRVVDATGSPVAGATVSAGPSLWGTGSRASAPDGMGGPPGSSDVKQTTTNDRGEFTISGVSRTTRVIVAEHDTHGRSTPIAFASLDRSVTNVQLSLVAFGSLEGRVKLGSAPASRIIVNAQSKTVPEAMYSVITGDDGSYRFDRLAPDTYSVSAMTGADPMAGFGFHLKTITVVSGKSAKLDLSIDAGEVTLAVQPKAAAPVMFAMVYSVRGTLTATTAKEFEQKTLALEGGQTAFGMAIAGQPAKITKLAPGTYTICASPFPKEVGADVEDYLVREGDRLPVFCKTIQLSAKSEQALEIPVEIPAFVPDQPET